MNAKARALPMPAMATFFTIRLYMGRPSIILARRRTKEEGRECDKALAGNRRRNMGGGGNGQWGRCGGKAEPVQISNATRSGTAGHSHMDHL